MTERSNGDRVPDDLALVAARLGAGLRQAGMPADPGRCERFARAVPLVRPATRYELYLCALATFASGPEQIETLQQVFRDLFGPAGGRGAGRTGRHGPPRRPGPPRTTCWPGPPGPRRTIRRHHPVLTAPVGRTARTVPVIPSAAKQATPRSQDLMTSRRPPAGPWPAGRSGWRARISPS